MLLVPRWTFRPRLLEYGITDLAAFYKISNDKLGNLIWGCQNTHGFPCRCYMTLGYSNSIGIIVQQMLVMESLVCVNPDGFQIRWSLIIRREVSNDPAPNSLWLIDSHHSLI